MTDAQNGCPSCGTISGLVWPPAVLAEPPKAEPLPVRLLTGTVWLDETLGIGLCWLLFWGLEKAVSLISDIYISHMLHTRYSSHFLEAFPVDAMWLGVSLLALTFLAGTYAGLHRFFPKIGRGFGQNALIGAGMGIVVVLWATLFP